MFERETQQIPYALVLALLLSVLLHLVLVVHLLPRLQFEAPPRSDFPDLSVQLAPFSRDLRSGGHDGPAEDSPDAASAADPIESRAAPATMSPAPEDLPPPRYPRRTQLNLSLPPMDFTTPPQPGGPTGTVFDSELRSRIAATRQSRAVGRAGDSPALGTDPSSYSGGQWETLLQVGDLCFRVIEANPLDTLSNEQWFQVDCD